MRPAPRPDAEDLGRRLVESAVLDEVAARLRLGGRGERGRVELLGELVDLKQSLALTDVVRELCLQLEAEHCIERRSDGTDYFIYRFVKT